MSRDTTEEWRRKGFAVVDGKLVPIPNAKPLLVWKWSEAGQIPVTTEAERALLSIPKMRKKREI